MDGDLEERERGENTGVNRCWLVESDMAGVLLKRFADTL